jgi:hypothetical protein
MRQVGWLSAGVVPGGTIVLNRAAVKYDQAALLRPIIQRNAPRARRRIDLK